MRKRTHASRITAQSLSQSHSQRLFRSIQEYHQAHGHISVPQTYEKDMEDEPVITTTRPLTLSACVNNCTSGIELMAHSLGADLNTGTVKFEDRGRQEDADLCQNVTA